MSRPKRRSFHLTHIVQLSKIKPYMYWRETREHLYPTILVEVGSGIIPALTHKILIQTSISRVLHVNSKLHTSKRERGSVAVGWYIMYAGYCVQNYGSDSACLEMKYNFRASNPHVWCSNNHPIVDLIVVCTRFLVSIWASTALFLDSLIHELVEKASLLWCERTAYWRSTCATNPIAYCCKIAKSITTVCISCAGISVSIDGAIAITIGIGIAIATTSTVPSVYIARSIWYTTEPAYDRCCGSGSCHSRRCTCWRCCDSYNRRDRTCCRRGTHCGRSDCWSNSFGTGCSYLLHILSVNPTIGMMCRICAYGFCIRLHELKTSLLDNVTDKYLRLWRNTLNTALRCQGWAGRAAAGDRVCSLRIATGRRFCIVGGGSRDNTIGWACRGIYSTFLSCHCVNGSTDTRSTRSSDCLKRSRSSARLSYRCTWCSDSTKGWR